MARGDPATRPNYVSSAALLLSTVILIGFVGLAIFEFSNWDKISPGVSALGIPVGGQSRAEAVSRLSPGVQQLLDRPLEIRGADQVWPTTARDLGLRLDPNELVAAAYQIGRNGSPTDRLGEQIDVFLHGHTVTAASTTDQAALDTSLRGMATQIERAPRDAKLSLSRTGTVEYTESQPGLQVDIRASRDQVTTALSSGSRTAELITHPIAPAIPDEQLRTAREQLERLLQPEAQPLTLTFGQQSYRLERPDMLKLLSLTGGTRPGQPAVLNIDEAPLKAWAARMAKDIDQPVQDARFRFNGGNLVALRTSKQGRTVDQSAVVQHVREALLTGESNLQLSVEVTEPSVSSENPQALGITELIDRGSTSFVGSIPEKKHNIQLSAQRLNGVVVAPGATFSFNEAVGPTTLDAGFKWGFGITSGNDGPKTVPSVAGGICQVATTLFQPVFWSGYQLEERHWHLYWIPAYTSRNVVGLDVTVDPDSNLDFKWINTTSSYVLIQADADDERVYFGLYGKKPSWTVQVDDAVVTNRTPPDTKPIAQEEPTLQWGRTLVVETARDGFDVEVTRRVIPSDGGKPRELNLKSSYQPAHTVTLVGSTGKPAGANVEEAIQRVLEAQRQALEPKPSPTPETAGTPVTPAQPTAQPTAQPPTQPTAVSKPAPPAPTPTPSAPNPAPKPTAPPPTPVRR